MTQQRRRIDQVMDESFTKGIEDVPIDDLRARRVTCDELDTELSYYRRMLHGRMDLLDFELRRRSGEETRTLIEALPRSSQTVPPVVPRILSTGNCPSNFPNSQAPESETSTMCWATDFSLAFRQPRSLTCEVSVTPSQPLSEPSPISGARYTTRTTSSRERSQGATGKVPQAPTKSFRRLRRGWTMHVSHLDAHPSSLAAATAPPFRHKQ